MSNETRTYEERREYERRTPDAERGPGHETYDEKCERWRRDWREEDSDV